MKYISTSNLVPGMVVAEDILDYHKNCIIPTGVVLTTPIINRLSSYAIYSVAVEDDTMPELFQTDMTHSLKEEQAQLINQFQQEREVLVYHLRDSMLSAVNKQVTLKVDELVTETLQLIRHQDYSKINIFELLLYTQWHEDSIFSHSVNVALIAYALAGWVHYSEEEQSVAVACGLFHDIGKLLVPPGILQKPERLSPTEFEIIKTHTTEGYHILKHMPINSHIKAAALMHHEKCDGSGYPYGLKGDAIDPFAKLITIADIYEAMTSVRVYRNSICPFQVISHFEENGLDKYDNEYILAFLQNTANAYTNHKVTLSNGLEGTVVFINKEHTSQPTVHVADEFWDLSQNLNIFIETVL